MKKRIFYIVATAAMLASCSTDFDLSEKLGGGDTSETIGFSMRSSNSTRANQNLQKTEHYNFGVFGYKSSDKQNAVMNNYLVGYCDDNNGYQKTGTTWGDQNSEENGQSYWAYENMGYEQYFGTYAGQPLTDDFKSNNAKQFLKYWDKSAESTCFYAYAPYIHGSLTATYVDGTKQSPSEDTYTLTLPEGSIKSGMNDVALTEYMYASTKVEKANYGSDVSLLFKRLNAKVNIKFWEDIAGYSVRILDLKQGTYEGVQAVPAIYKTSDTTTDPKPAGEDYKPYGYRKGIYYSTNGIKIQFANGAATSFKQFKNQSTQEPLVFTAPTDAQIGTSRLMASPSSDTYYAIPKGDGEQVISSVNPTAYEDVNKDFAKTGFTFHVSYELTAEDTGERIVVKNATVFVPADYCKWTKNTHYTYIFKITKNSNGSTDEPTIDPTDPDVPTVQSLYPIVFDNCTVEDWVENDSEWEITDGTALGYYSVQLSDYSMTNSQDNSLTVKVKRVSKKLGDSTISDAVVSVTKPNDTEVTSSSSDTDISITAGNITVKAGAPVGTYTVCYEVPNTDIDNNQPRKVYTTFTVGNAYQVMTNVQEVGTRGTAATKLDITSKKATTGTSFAEESSSDGTYEIEYLYKSSLPETEKGYVKVNGSQVEIAPNAVPGWYVLAYKVGGNVVARSEFKVVEYPHNLDKMVVLLDNTTQEVKPVASTGVTLTESTSLTSTNITITGGNTISVPSNAVEGRYVVNYTLYNGQTHTVTYQPSFDVFNNYSISMDKNIIDRNDGYTGASEQGTDKIQISTKKNATAETINSTIKALMKVYKEDGTEVTAGFTISDTGVLNVNHDFATGNYYVEYNPQSAPSGLSHDYKVRVNFRVVE